MQECPPAPPRRRTMEPPGDNAAYDEVALLDLSIELLGHVVHFLPLPGFAHFALSCHTCRVAATQVSHGVLMSEVVRRLTLSRAEEEARHHDGLKPLVVGDAICRKCPHIELPPSITEIGHSAFRDCPSLLSIRIPTSVTALQSMAFSGCTSCAQLGCTMD